MSPSVLASEWETDRRASLSQWSYKGHLSGCFHKLTATRKCDKTATVIESTAHCSFHTHWGEWVNVNGLLSTAALYLTAVHVAGQDTPPPQKRKRRSYLINSRPCGPSWRQNTRQSSAWPSMQCFVVLFCLVVSGQNLYCFKIKNKVGSKLSKLQETVWMCNIFRVRPRKKLDKSKYK